MKQKESIYKFIVSPYIENKRFKDLNPTNFGWTSMYGNNEGTGVMIRKEYIIHYVTEGKGEVLINGKKHIVKKGQCFFLKANDVASFKSANTKSWSWVWIIFTGELAKNFDDLKDQIFDFKSDVFIEIMNNSERIKMREEYLVSRLFEIYRVVFGEYSNFDIATAAEIYIRKANEIDIPVQAIASELQVSRNYLSYVFKKKHGITIQEYIFRRKMRNAKDLMLQEYSLKYIAEKTGYADVYAFSKAFKKFYGISPGKATFHQYPEQN